MESVILFGITADTEDQTSELTLRLQVLVCGHHQIVEQPTVLILVLFPEDISIIMDIIMKLQIIRITGLQTNITVLIPG